MRGRKVVSKNVKPFSQHCRVLEMLRRENWPLELSLDITSLVSILLTAAFVGCL